MALLDLRCPVPSEGAHRLAWVIGTADDPAGVIRDLEEKIGVNMVDRLLSGTLTPGERMGAALWLVSGGRVDTRMFYRPTTLRWWQAPAGFEPRQPVKQAA